MAVEIMKQVAFSVIDTEMTDNPFDMPAQDTGSYVVHNFQHDLESVWWILVWILTEHTGRTSEICKQWVQQAFTVSMVVSKEREACIVHGANWRALMHEPFQQHFSPTIARLQIAMIKEYRERPKITNLDHTTVLNLFSSIHSFFDGVFSNLLAVRDSDWGSFTLAKRPFLDKPARKKRTRLPHTSSKSNGHEYVPPSSDEEDVRSDSTSERQSRPEKKKKVTSEHK